MASVETIIRQDRVTYRGIPWIVLPNGKRKKGPTKTFDSESAAMSYAVRIERGSDGDVEAFGLSVDRNRKRVLFGDYATQYARRMPGTPNTRKTRMDRARVVGRQFEKRHLDEIDRALINTYLAEMHEEELAPDTIYHRFSFLRLVMAEALRDKIIDEDPCRDIESPKRVSMRGHRPPTEHELALIIKAMPDWFEVAILLANDSGLRAAEICGLRWCRIDLQRGRVTVRDVMERDGALRPYPKGRARAAGVAAFGAHHCRAAQGEDAQSGQR